MLRGKAERREQAGVVERRDLGDTAGLDAQDGDGRGDACEGPLVLTYEGSGCQTAPLSTPIWIFFAMLLLGLRHFAGTLRRP